MNPQTSHQSATAKEPAGAGSAARRSRSGKSQRRRKRAHKKARRRSRNLSSTATVNSQEERWPFCIVWTPLPVLSWLVPIIGHTGITNSRGVIYDFSDDYNVSVDNFSFGRPTKIYQFSENFNEQELEAWDKAIQETSDFYSRTRHSFCFNNCHQYIAAVLNKVRYQQRADWDQYEVWRMITFRSSYVGFRGFLRQWWPFGVLLAALVVLLSLLL